MSDKADCVGVDRLNGFRLDHVLSAHGRFRISYVYSTCYDTYMPKLTLSVNEKVVQGAKRYAAVRGTSVSRLVERYLALLSKPPKSDDQTPVLRMLRGAARGVPADAHRRHLSRKYR
jgi:hypothetical protein